MPSVALVTYGALPGLSESDRVLAAELKRADTAVRAVSWDAQDVAWGDFDLVVLRSVWDYHERFEAFIAWLDARRADGARVANPLGLVRWNLDKRYLLDLARNGIRITPTVLIERGSSQTLADVLDAQGWDDVVVKPNISASAARTFRSTRMAAGRDQHRLAQMLEARAALVQPFVEAVRDGEWSFMFIEGVFTHAVLKRAAPGEFRVQEQYGGTSVRTEAPAELIRQAGDVLAPLPVVPLYARVDACVVDGALQLMELELIEPTLFFDLDAAAARRMAGAVRRLAMRDA